MREKMPALDGRGQRAEYSTRPWLTLRDVKAGLRLLLNPTRRIRAQHNDPRRNHIAEILDLWSQPIESCLKIQRQPFMLPFLAHVFAALQHDCLAIQWNALHNQHSEDPTAEAVLAEVRPAILHLLIRGYTFSQVAEEAKWSLYVSGEVKEAAARSTEEVQHMVEEYLGALRMPARESTPTSLSGLPWGVLNHGLLPEHSEPLLEAGSQPWPQVPGVTDEDELPAQHALGIESRTASRIARRYYGIDSEKWSRQARHA
ncbi:hypothetical protein JCM10908_001870 [Rhodotorula pacifica]|uniref:uncharacterized protein n=1 Tax=Rhodotorula pacifica TaxID=1495444 RepID=UPI003173A658